MKEIILHIGARKAGSTTIQKTLAKNPDVLHKHGCRYLEAARMPESRGDGHYAHHRAARTGEGDGYWSDITEEIDETDYERYVLSSELLYTLPAGDIERIKKYLQASSVKQTTIVMVIRAPIDFIRSEYKQQIKITNEHRGIVEFARENLDRCKHHEAVEKGETMLENDRSVVWELSAFKGEEGSLVRAVCQVLGIPGNELTERKTNTSLTDERTEVLRLFNKVFTWMNLYDTSRHVRQLKNSIKRGRAAGRVVE